MPMTRLRDLVRREPRPRVQLPTWIERVVSVGIVSGDGQIVRCQRCVNVGAFAMVATAGSHLITNSLHDFRGLLPINAGNVVMLVGALLVPRMHRFGEHAGAITLLLLILFGHTFIVWSFGLASELQVYFTLAGAIVFFFGVPNWRLCLAFYAVFVLALMVALQYAPGCRPGDTGGHGVSRVAVEAGYDHHDHGQCRAHVLCAGHSPSGRDRAAGRA